MFQLKLSRDSGFSSKTGIIPPKSGWMDICKGLRGILENGPPEKIQIRSLQTAGNALKLSILPPSHILCNFKYFTIPSLDPFAVNHANNIFSVAV